MISLMSGLSMISLGHDLQMAIKRPLLRLCRNLHQLLPPSSQPVRAHFIQAKRKRSKVLYSDLFPDSGLDDRLNIYEMLPPSVHKLKLTTEEAATNYKYVWATDRKVCIRQSDKSESIAIVTEHDLQNL